MNIGNDSTKYTYENVDKKTGLKANVLHEYGHAIFGMEHEH